MGPVRGAGARLSWSTRSEAAGGGLCAWPGKPALNRAFRLRCIPGRMAYPATADAARATLQPCCSPPLAGTRPCRANGGVWAPVVAAATHCGTHPLGCRLAGRLAHRASHRRLSRHKAGRHVSLFIPRSGSALPFSCAAWPSTATNSARRWICKASVSVIGRTLRTQPARNLAIRWTLKVVLSLKGAYG